MTAQLTEGVASPRRRHARVVTFLLTGFIVASLTAHAIYATKAAFPPSSDEAHYMTGVYRIGTALTQGPKESWQAFTTALGFKAPLVCVPAAALYAFSSDTVLAARLSLVLTFAALALISFVFFRRMLEPLWAACATAFLLGSPVITGLTHRFYTELLLLVLTLLYVEVLVAAIQRPSLFPAAGLIAGLGLLCKTTFAPLVLLPTSWLLVQGFLVNRKRRRIVPYAAGKAAFAIVTLLVAWTWYGRNWTGAMQHIRNAAECPSCEYPVVQSLLVVLSSGPHIGVSLLAIAGLYFIAPRLRTAGLTSPVVQRWASILLIAAFTLVAFLSTPNKSVRGTVTMLPTIAALAAVTLERIANRSRRPLLVASIGLLLTLLSILHISFGLPRTPAVRLGDLRIFDTHHPLNPPHWYEDNHPLDTPAVDLAAIERFIAADHRERTAPGDAAIIGVTFHSLSVTYDYLNLLAQINGHNTRYLPPYALPADWTSVGYLIRCKGCERLNPGAHNHDMASATLARSQAAGVRFISILRSPGPDGAGLEVLRREP